jgi:hypothetical protein
VSTCAVRRSRPAGLLALGLLLWAACGPVVRAAAPAEEGLAAIRGVLYETDEITRLKGARVTAINVQTGRRYVSNFTGDNGAYEILGLPEGTYDIAIDTQQMVYVTGSLVDLAAKQWLYLSFSVKPKGTAAPGSPAPQGEAKMTFTDPNAVPAATTEPKKKGFWKSAGGITLITILVAGVVGAGVAAQHN